MATEQELIDALMKADKAGDTASAQIFADQIKKLRATDAVTGTTAPQRDFMKEASESLKGFNPDPDADPTRDIEKSRNVRKYNELPEWQKPVQAFDDIMRKTAEGVSFGYADKAAAMLSPGKYEENLAAERKRTQDAEDRAGWAGTAANVTGGLATGKLAANAGLTLGGRLSNAASPLWQRLLGASATGAVEGAGYGALDAAGHDKDIKEGAIDSALFGGALGPVAEGATSALGSIISKIKGVNKSPSLDELGAQKQAAYKAMEESGAKYTPQSILDLVDDIKSATVNKTAGATEVMHPKTVDKISQLEDIVPTTTAGKVSKKAKPVSLYDIDEHRKSLSRDLSSDPGEAHWADIIREKIDDFTANTDPSKITATKGTPEEAVEQLMKGREINTRLRKAEDLSAVMRKAERSAEATNSATPGNLIRSRVASLLNNDKKSMGLSTEEVERLDNLIKGTWWGNTTRNISSGARHVMGQAAGSSAGYAAANLLAPGNPLAAAGGITGGMLAAHGLSNMAGAASEKSTRKGLQEIIEDISRGKPRVPNRKAAPLSTKDVDELTRALMLLRLTGQNDQ